MGAVAGGLRHSHSNTRIRAASVTYVTAHSNAGWILNPLSEARDGTCVLRHASQIRICRATRELFCVFSLMAILVTVKWYLIVVFIFISLVTVVSISSCAFWPFFYLLQGTITQILCPYFFKAGLSFDCWVVRVLYISWMLRYMIVDIFSHCVGCLFTFLIVLMDVQQFFPLPIWFIQVFIKQLFREIQKWLQHDQRDESKE